MKIFDNITETVRDNLAVTLKRGCRVSIAAACFSMYAYNELKKQLEGVDDSVLFSVSRLLLKKKPTNRNGNFISDGK